ncbi:putative RNA recognition motif domain, nucleotide-binding alpha-beta plait domain superfamily [Helianthus debilis subsp. tardiflorus]
MGDRRRKPIPVEIQRRITKIFITNLPDGCSGADLAGQIREFGQIYDLYIVRKRDTHGNRFGFVSMLDVKDKVTLINNIRGIRMGEYRLWCSVARFVLEDGEINNNREDIRKPLNHKNYKQHVEEVIKEGTSATVDKGAWLFKDMLVGKTLNIDGKINAFSGLYGKAFIASMADLDSLKNIKVIIREVCTSEFKVQYLGGLDVLLSFIDKETAIAVHGAVRSFESKFLKTSIWNGQVIGFERLAWLKVQGLPLNLIDNGVINSVGGMFGKVVHKANRAENDNDLSFEYVGVLVGNGGKVSEEVLLSWKDRKFRVWVMEELDDWTPDFIEPRRFGGEAANESENKSLTSDSDGNTLEDESMKKDEELEGVTGVESDPLQAAYENTSDFQHVDGFVPAATFPFEQFLDVNEPTKSIDIKTNKRKKFKKAEGSVRPSNTYTSSNESLKAGKKVKQAVSVDLFGLNSLLGLGVDKPIDNHENSSLLEGNAPLDLNS